MRSDLAARVRSAREQATTDARGGEDEVSAISLSFLTVHNLIVDDESDIPGRREETASKVGKRS